MSARKTIVGTNTSLNGDTVSSTIDITNKPTNSVVNNLNVTVRGTEDKVTTEVSKEETPTEKPAVSEFKLDNPYENMVKYPTTTSSGRDIEILKYLMQTFQNIIVNDPECAVNLIDQSGLVVLNAHCLIHLIAMVCDVDDSCVKLEIEDVMDIGCCGALAKVLPLKPIRSIKVMKLNDVYNDFQLTYNSYYNKIIDDYRVSLESVYQKAI